MNPTQFEEQTQSLHRLRSARNKRQAVIEARNKHILHMDREMRRIRALETPVAWYPRGLQPLQFWKPFLTISSVCLNQRTEDRYRNILSILNARITGSSRRMKRLSLQHDPLSDTRLKMLTLSETEWQEVTLTPAEKALFELRKFRKNGRYVYQYRIADPDIFGLLVRQYHTGLDREQSDELRSQRSGVDAFFSDKRLDARRNKLRDKKWHDHFENIPKPQRRARTVFRSTPLHRLISETD